MNYKIETLPEFTVLTQIREFNIKNSKTEIPKFWQQYYQNGYGAIACGQFGICFDAKPDGTFHYGIGNRCEVEKKK